MTLTLESTEIKGIQIALLFDKTEGHQVRIMHKFNDLWHIDSLKNYLNEKVARVAYKRALKNYK